MCISYPHLHTKIVDKFIINKEKNKVYKNT